MRPSLKKLSKGAFLPFAALSLAVSLYGCGPGFPIMTDEQEKLVKNVDRLVKENSELKTRLSALEAGGGIRAELDAMKRSVAEANAGIEGLRHELSFAKGSAEESGLERARVKEALDSVKSSIKSADERLKSLEKASTEDAEAIASIRSAIDNNDRKLGDLKDAIASVEKKAVASAEASRMAQSQPQDAKKGEEPPDAMYARGYKETIDKDYAKAAETFKAFLANHSGHKLAGNAQYWLGEVYYARGDWELAILEFDKAIKKYSESEKVPAAILKEALSFEKLGSKKEARVLLNEVLDRFPKSPEAKLAKKRLESLK